MDPYGSNIIFFIRFEACILCHISSKSVGLLSALATDPHSHLCIFQLISCPDKDLEEVLSCACTCSSEMRWRAVKPALRNFRCTDLSRRSASFPLQFTNQ
jgi:hypothetical protein